ncbi:MAG: hypothetical protein GXO82_06290 [Chlorobi bacterium]|nr:hypothetical protein [Chlorobiota bacterium]
MPLWGRPGTPIVAMAGTQTASFLSFRRDRDDGNQPANCPRREDIGVAKNGLTFGSAGPIPTPSRNMKRMCRGVRFFIARLDVRNPRWKDEKRY